MLGVVLVSSSSIRARCSSALNVLLLLLLLLLLASLLLMMPIAAAAADVPQGQQPVCSSSSSNNNNNYPDDETCGGPLPSSTTTTTSNGGITTTTTTTAFSDNAACRVLLAPSSIKSDAAGLGVFIMDDRAFAAHSGGRQPVLDGDVVVQIPDLVQVDPGLQSAVRDYFWSADETMGFYEGQRTPVVSAAPGIGALANGMPETKANVVPDGGAAFSLRVDEAGLTRANSPTAGAVTHYHNFTFVWSQAADSSNNVTAGQEVLVHYGANWFRAHHHEQQGVDGADDDGAAVVEEHEHEHYRRPVDWLRRHGRCLDHLAPQQSSRQEPNAGRGAVARRDLRRGAIVAPVPLLALHRASLQRRRLEKRDGTTAVDLPPPQLLLNYCLGHPESSLLLFPYGAFVNLVNHGAGQSANVRLQWSTSKVLYGPSFEPDWFRNLTVEELLLSRTQQDRGLLLLELVALRDIRAGEEVLLDYGEDFVRAYEHHVEHWEPVPGAHAYAPSYVYDDVIKTLRTEKELKDHPYPDNIFTSCYYRYSDNKSEAEQQQLEVEQEQQQQKTRTVTAFRWRRTRGLLEPRNLRPCSVLQRNEGDGTFTVRIRNRYGLAAEERLPRGALHIVTHVPRYAIRFSDKIYTTDQHLENAFRHEIGIPDDIFPEKWKDLKRKNTVDQ